MIKKSATILTLILLSSCVKLSENKDTDMIHDILAGEVIMDRRPSVHYAIFDPEKIIRRYAYGYSDIGNKKEVNENITYNAYSVTKTFTALAILQLAEQNKLSLDDTVKKISTTSLLLIKIIMCDGSQM